MFKKIIVIQYCHPNRFFNDSLLQSIDQHFDYIKRDFHHQILTGPFHIYIGVSLHYGNLGKVEESDEEFEVINAEQIFKSEECVICLTNPPNVLFCNCGHLCICEECDKVKSLNTCPVCKTETTIKRNMKY